MNAAMKIVAVARAGSSLLGVRSRYVGSARENSLTIVITITITMTTIIIIIITTIAVREYQYQ